MAICKKCGHLFNTKRYFTCPDCAFYSKLKQIADESGNPKIYTRDQYDQEFLKTLIPVKG